MVTMVTMVTSERRVGNKRTQPATRLIPLLVLLCGGHVHGTRYQSGLFPLSFHCLDNFRSSACSSAARVKLLTILTIEPGQASGAMVILA